MKLTTIVVTVGAAAALAALAALAYAPFAGAQESDSDAWPRSERRAAFLERVAEKLGVDVATLQQALNDARLEAIDEALADGRITEERAEKARERIANGEGPRRPREPHRLRERREAFVATSAAAIGVSPAELRASLKAGSSIADVAAANNVPLDVVKAAIVDAAKTKLAAAVANGRIDQARADELLTKLESRLDELLNRKKAVASTP